MIYIEIHIFFTFTMPQSLAEFDSQYLSSGHRKGIRLLPTTKSFRAQENHNTHQRSTPAYPSPLTQEPLSQSKHHHRQESSTSSTASTATSRSSTTTSMSSHPTTGPMSAKEATLKAQEFHLNSDVAEWAHQMHLTQGRSYWWCQACFPKELVEPLHIPKAVEKVVTGRRVRINEPSHCYDI